MDFFAFVCLLAVFAYLGMGIYSYILNSKRKISRIFLMISFIFAFWSFSAFLRNLFATDEIIFFWRLASAISWSMGTCGILHFVLLLIDGWVGKKRLFWVYLPGLILLAGQYSLGNLFAASINDGLAQLFGFIGDNVFYMIYLILSCVLLSRWGRKSQRKRERIQAKLVSGTLLITALLIFLYGTVLASMVDFVLPFITPLFPMVWVTGMWIAITRYRLMTLKAGMILDKIMENVLDFVVVINAEGKIIDINNRCLEILETEREMLVGSPFKNILSQNKDVVELFEEMKQGTHDEINREITYTIKPDRSLPIRLKITTIRDDFDDILGFIMAARDLSMEKQFEWLSITDKLTQIYNRQKLDAVLEVELSRGLRYKGMFAIIMADIDGFKRINDTHGHLVGDEILVELSRLIRDNIRKVDVPGRWGGEEFLIILPDCDIKSGQIVAEKIRKKIEGFGFKSGINVTCSFGVAQFNNEQTIEKIISRADEALYNAKAKGKNRVEVLK